LYLEYLLNLKSLKYLRHQKYLLLHLYLKNQKHHHLRYRLNLLYLKYHLHHLYLKYLNLQKCLYYLRYQLYLQNLRFRRLKKHLMCLGHLLYQLYQLNLMFLK